MTAAAEKFKEWWIIILFIGGLVVGWTNFDNRLRLVESTLADQNPIYLQIQKDIVEIKTSIEFIRLELQKH